ncbi:MAG: hypothetical protein ACKORL_08105 [Phycisphaerales bacterium]
MNDPFHEHVGEHLDDPALRALAERLDAAGRSYDHERPGLADRVHAASVRHLAGARTAPVAVIGRWWYAAAAAVMLALSVTAVVRFGAGPGAAKDIASVGMVRTAQLDPAGGSESLLVALIDQDAALDGESLDGASAIALTHRGSPDLVEIELEELLATGGRR